MDVNLYIQTSVHGPRRVNGCYVYILECITQKGPATLTQKKLLEDTTEHGSLCMAILDALARISKPCNLSIKTECGYIEAVFRERWIDRWRQQDWKNQKGKPVADAETWKKIAEILNEKGISVATSQQEPNEYSDWLRSEVKRLMPLGE